MKKRIFAAFLLLFAIAWCFGQANLAKGEELFMHNNPAEAVIYLENSIAEDPDDVKAFLYLGIVYEQMDKIDEAIAVYRTILDRAGDLAATVANNLGNAYFRKDSAAEAEAMYTRAIMADRVFASAYLGRANARIKKGALREAVGDYEQYLLLEPNTRQRPQIERLVAYIKAEFAEGERRRMVAEEAARAAAAEAERQRQLAEEAARAERDRRQRLLDEVTASLHSAAEASKGLSTGAEDVEGYEGEFELE